MPNIPIPKPVEKPSTSTSKQAPSLPKDFNKDQANRAVKALIAHHLKDKKRQEEQTLISKDEHVHLCITTRRIPTKKSNKPARIQLPHPPLPPPPTTSVCLFSKDPQRKYKDLLHDQNIKFIARVVGVEKLRGKHKPFEARRALCKDHDVFLCDDAIMRIMPKLLGKVFFDAKKQPVPVNMQSKNLKYELGQAISSAFFLESMGTQSTVRIATAAHHTPDQVLENLLSAIPLVVSKITDQWDNIKSIGIKTSGSMLLPLYSTDVNKLLGDDDVDVKVLSKAEKKRRRGEVDSDDDSEMTGSDVEMNGLDGEESEEEEVPAKKGKQAGKHAAPAVKKLKKDELASPAKKAKVAESPKAAKAAAPVVKAKPSPKKAEAAPAPAKPVEKEPKKVMAGKAADSVPAKKKVATARPSAKAGLVGKKAGSKRA